MKRSLLFALPVVLFAVLAGFFVWGLRGERNPSFVPSTMIDEPIPEFDFPGGPLLGDSGFGDEDLRQGRVVVINFFASWCVPCRAEHPFLSELVEQYGVVLWGVNHRDKPENAKAFLDELGDPYERIGVDDGRGIVSWGVYGLPETFVIDGAGRIRFHHRGPLFKKTMERDLLPVVQALQSQ
jgi:cytochrome c biogenesis protein CcmG/thiol:disulfide interchange protein DsbE